jgi:hypothetical protein
MRSSGCWSLGGLNIRRLRLSETRVATGTNASTGAASASKLTAGAADIAGGAPIEAQALSATIASTMHANLIMANPRDFRGTIRRLAAAASGI